MGLRRMPPCDWRATLLSLRVPYDPCPYSHVTLGGEIPVPAMGAYSGAPCVELRQSSSKVIAHPASC